MTPLETLHPFGDGRSLRLVEHRARQGGVHEAILSRHENRRENRTVDLDRK